MLIVVEYHLFAVLLIVLEFSAYPTKLFSDLYLPKFLDASAKSFCIVF